MGRMNTGGSEFRKALVVGTVRNATSNVNLDLRKIIDELGAILPTSAFVVESDSQDDTVQSLTRMAERDSRMRFVSLGNMADEIPNRIDRLRHCRNVYVNEIRQNPDYKDCDLIVVMDLDGINTKITLARLETALNTDVKWDALAANQSARYYDILALRHPLWSPNDCLAEAEWLGQFLGRKAAWRHAVGDRMIRIPETFPPIPVHSAFGGLCLYKRWVFEECDYLGEASTKVDESEHVTLHRMMRSKGGDIFVHPGLVNARWTVHSLDGSPLVRGLKVFAHKLPFRLFLPALRRITLLVSRMK